MSNKFSTNFSSRVDVTYVDPKYMNLYSWEYIEVNWWRNFISNNSYLSLYASIIYLCTIFIGQKLMESRDPFKLNRIYTIWNTVLALFCLMGFVRSIPELIYILSTSSDGFYKSLCTWENGHNKAAAFWTLMFVLSKFVELGDTLWIVIRKRTLMTLHVWHHISIVNFVWLVYDNYEPRFRWFSTMNYFWAELNEWIISEQSFYLLNFFSHGVMYSYFAITSLKVKFPKIINKAIMGIQLSQMVMGVLLVGASLWIKGEEWKGLENCVNPLGMENGRIPSHQISASSSFDIRNVGPNNGRIRNEIGAGAWCPHSPIKEGVKEFLEIDFVQDTRITQTETQGRFGNGKGQEYAESFQLEYWRDSLGRWIEYTDYLGRSILRANVNTYTSVIQNLNPPIIAQRIRFIPYSIHPRTTCLRVEVYGCNYEGGIIHYEAPQGKKSPVVDLRDMSYDGLTDEENILRRGLGLLTDSILGPNDFRPYNKNKGNGWIGWANDSEPVKIGFQFDRLRKFFQLSVHVNNFVSQGAQVFSQLDIYFSVDGIKFSEFPFRYQPKSDLKNESAQIIQVPLKSRLASYIRLEFHHSNHWLLLSEIFFTSEIFTGNITEDIHSLNYLQDGPDGNDQKDLDDVLGTRGNGSKTTAIVAIVAASLSVFVLISIVTLICFIMRKNRRNTKLVGVMKGIPPKSMSVGLGLGNSGGGGGGGRYGERDFDRNVQNNQHQMRLGKIALCDLKPVSISHPNGQHERETDSDESLYHDLVFGIENPAGKYSDSGSSSHNSSTNAQRNCMTNHKIKYQRVNHGGDFTNEFMGARSYQDEASFFHSSPLTTHKSSIHQQIHHHNHPNNILFGPPPSYRPIPLPGQHYSHLSLSKSNNCSKSTGAVFTTNTSKAGPIAQSASNTLFNSPHHIGGGGRRSRQGLNGGYNTAKSPENNYYAATDIFKVSDKHFDRF